jgi:hypothetical protein
MPFDGYTSREVCELLRRSRANLQKMDVLAKTYPFGPKNPLYDRADVEKWQLALRRHDGLVALRRRHPKVPLLKAMEIGADHDTECPRCGGWAIADPEASEDRPRVWCPRCKAVGPEGR